MQLVLGIDLGTTFFKLALFDRDGELRGLGRVPVPIAEPQPGYAELTAADFQKTLKMGVHQALEQAGAEAADIQAVGYSSQANSIILLDKECRPLAPFFIWTDMRGEPVDPRVQQLWERDDYLETVGQDNRVPQQTLSKICWLQNHHPEMWHQARKIMNISDYMVFNLTGEIVSDTGTTSLLALWDLPHSRWWQAAFKILDIPEDLLPPPKLPMTLAGHTTANAARFMGLPENIPVIIGSLDHHMAAIGVGIGHHAQVSESTGTVIACLRYLDGYEPRSRCLMGVTPDSGFYQLAFSDDGTGTLDWYWKNYAKDLTLPQLTQMAAKVCPGADGLFAQDRAQNFDGLTGFLNQTPNHHQGHFARAIMEQKARLLKQNIDYLHGSGKPDRIIATGGGSKSDAWSQIMADMMNIEILATGCEEPACLGAAAFAALAKNWYLNYPAIVQNWITLRKTFQPQPHIHKTYQKLLSSIPQF